MVLELPPGFIWKDESRLAWCSSCNTILPCSNEKQLKQHLKSRTHKKLSVVPNQQPEQLATLLEAQHFSSNGISHVIAPEQYQEQHLEALHIAGTFHDDSSYPGFYYYSSASSQHKGIPHADDCTSSSCKHISDSCSAKFRQQQAADEQRLQPQPERQTLRPCWPPPFAVKPKAAFLAGRPFLTLVCGSIPKVPSNLDEVLQYYCQPGACRLPNIDMAGVNQQVKSWSHAAKLLRAAAAAAATAATDYNQDTNHDRLPASSSPAVSSASGIPNGSPNNSSNGTSDTAAHHQQCSVPVVYWASLVADNITHPSWWPKTGHVPTYDNIIIGSGPSGIGLHRDVDHAVCHHPPPVATYLTIVRGRKHVIVLPPDQTLFDVKDNDQTPFPLNPSPDLLKSIRSCGGCYFDFQPCYDGSPVTLYIPEGWLHWLVGAADWHVVFGGSIKTRPAV